MAGKPPVGVGSQVDYVLGNATAIGWVDHRWIEQSTWGLNRTVLNVSIWSLRWELACYAGVLVLGVVGLLRARVVAVVAAVAWALAVCLMLLEVPDDFVFGIFPMPRLVLMFSLGALAYLLGDRVPFDHTLAAAGGLWVAAAAFTPDYRVFAAPGMVYLVLWIGLAAGRWPVLRLRNDVSYGVYVYGAPVQQALLVAGVSVSWLAFSLLSFAIVLPLAAASWFLVERPAQRLARGRAPIAPPVGETIRQ